MIQSGTDLHNAKLFLQQHGEYARWNNRFKYWQYFDKEMGIWEKDDSGFMWALAVKTVSTLEPDTWARQCQSAERIKSMLELVKGLQFCPELLGQKESPSSGSTGTEKEVN